MTLPVPDREPLVIYDRQGADDFAALGEALASYRAQQGPVNFVYAPTTVIHQHRAPFPAVGAGPGTGGPNHPGIDVDLTGYGGDYEPPRFVAPLPAVPERRSLAPLAFLLCGWSSLAAALTTAVTGGDPAAIGATFAALAGAGISFGSLYRAQA